jgi:hypothetical protein
MHGADDEAATAAEYRKPPVHPLPGVVRGLNRS